MHLRLCPLERGFSLSLGFLDSGIKKRKERRSESVSAGRCACLTAHTVWNVGVPRACVSMYPTSA